MQINSDIKNLSRPIREDENNYEIEQFLSQNRTPFTNPLVYLTDLKPDNYWHFLGCEFLRTHADRIIPG